MDKEPIEAKEIRYMTFQELLDLSMEEFRKRLGVPKVIEAEKPKDHVSNMVKDVVVDSSIEKDNK